MLSHDQLGLVLEGVIINLEVAECGRYDELKLHTPGPRPELPDGKQRVIKQIISAIVSRWPREALDGLELDEGRIFSAVAHELWKP